jgi:hypothetical protein
LQFHLDIEDTFHPQCVICGQGTPGTDKHILAPLLKTELESYQYKPGDIFFSQCTKSKYRAKEPFFVSLTLIKLQS